MTRFRVFLRGGGDFIIKARDFTVNYSNQTGDVIAYEIKGLEKDGWLFIAPAEIAAVVKVS